MRKAFKSAFFSDYGFNSPNFSVDQNGNISANSIILNVDTTKVLIDFSITDDENSNYIINDSVETNPPITLAKGRTYLLSLALTTTGFYILEEDQFTEYIQGLTHDTGATGTAAQGKLEGTLSITIPTNFDNDILYYTNSNRTFYGIINVVDPIGLFSSLSVTNTDNSTSKTTGTAIISGGVGVGKNLSIGGNLIFDNSTPVVIDSSADLTIVVANNLSLENEEGTIGVINSTGSTIPLVNTSIDNSSINNSTINDTPIGTSTPSTGNFTQGTVQTTGSNIYSLPNKLYVDSTALSLAITFGI